MLFSQDSVADSINQSFEPAWESVRPVPIVRIDFGNGNVLTRTLHGNILTSVCTPDGLVVDALPGIYTPDVYRAQLTMLHDFAVALQSCPAEKREPMFQAMHRAQSEAKATPYISKYTIERPVERVIASARPSKTKSAKREDAPPSVAAQDVDRWKELEEDTRLNERTRRGQINKLLAGTGLVRPDKVTRPIYKEVLHADLDDPYLGLGEVLFATYPFAKEDAVH